MTETFHVWTAVVATGRCALAQSRRNTHLKPENFTEGRSDVRKPDLPRAPGSQNFLSMGRRPGSLGLCCSQHLSPLPDTPMTWGRGMFVSVKGHHPYFSLPPSIIQILFGRGARGWCLVPFPVLCLVFPVGTTWIHISVAGHPLALGYSVPRGSRLLPKPARFMLLPLDRLAACRGLAVAGKIFLPARDRPSFKAALCFPSLTVLIPLKRDCQNQQSS